MAASAPSRDVTAMVKSAAAGDEAAWHALAVRFTPLLRSVARGFRLSPADVDDVVQTTWLRAVSRIDSLQEPAAIARWLVVTTRREALRHLQRGIHEVVTDEPYVRGEPTSIGPDAAVLDMERDAAVRTAVDRLPERQRRLIGALLARPGRSYEELSSALDMPVGSIGPTRERGFARLRDDVELARAVTP
jgi:RNA polymerase sigma factor (sigma-70 family)